MGDPVGPAEEREELVWRFRELADRAGAWCVFYEVSADQLAVYVDAGLALSKLGEEARVPLATFSLEGSARADLRQAHRRAGREGLSFRIVAAADVAPLLPQLRRISDDWLRSKATTEKRFSLGRFSTGYLQRCTIALVEHAGTSVAFANLWETQSREELSVDLMRQTSSAPRGTMDFLFTELMLWGKLRDTGALTSAWRRWRASKNIASRRHGTASAGSSSATARTSIFEGLRQFKEKFLPEWRPRYLAAPGRLALPGVLLDVTSLISGGMVGRYISAPSRPARPSKRILLRSAEIEMPRTVLRACCVCVLVLTSTTIAATPVTSTIEYPGLGTVTVEQPVGAPAQFVIFLSGDGGWNQGVADMAHHLVHEGALVAGVDVPQMAKHQDAARDTCVRPSEIFEGLSHFVQQKYGMSHYALPILVGYSSGATLAYATLAQSPPGTFKGAMSLGFCPDLDGANRCAAAKGWSAIPTHARIRLPPCRPPAGSVDRAAGRAGPGVRREGYPRLRRSRRRRGTGRPAEGGPWILRRTYVAAPVYGHVSQARCLQRPWQERSADRREGLASHRVARESYGTRCAGYHAVR